MFSISLKNVIFYIDIVLKGRLIMKKNRTKFAFLLLCTSFVLIIGGFVCSFIMELQLDRGEVHRRIVEVNNTFEEFSANISVFEEFRDQLYVSTLSNVYYTSLVTNDVAIKNKFSNYENIVDEIAKKVTVLDQLCTDMYYPDGSVNGKCNNYKLIYEQVVNCFVGDTLVYNKYISEYNQSVKDTGVGLLQEYHTKKKYIDYNNDKEFSGKEG